MFRAFLRIIAERRNSDHWTAWFAEVPTVSTTGEFAVDAVRDLMETFGWDELVASETTEMSLASRPGHLEFRVPLRRFRRIPTASIN
jgi:hypothetical protein